MQHSSKLIVELIGTFFLCLAVGLNANAGALNLIAIGSLLTALIYAGGHISGAHYNPAVTLAMIIRGRMKIGEAIGYWLVQIAGAAAAAVLVQFVFGQSGTGVSAIGELGAGITAELLGTFALVFVILHVATARSTEGNGFYGIAIGLTVVGAGYLLGPYSGGAFNPAVALSQSILEFFAWSDIWVYLVVCMAGGALAAYVFRMLLPNDK